MENDTYYKVKKSRRAYKGERYFRFNAMSEKTTQVCMTPGEEKKGKSNTFGVYLVHRNTFLSNYLSFGYVQSCSKKEYQKAFDAVVKMLS